jgi:hypothetical protein
MISQKRLEELVEESPCEESWCFFKELVSHMGERNVIQTRLMIEYRYMESKKQGADIGGNRADLEFTQKFGERFAEVYDKDKGECLSYDEIYSRVFGIPKAYETPAT